MSIASRNLVGTSIRAYALLAGVTALGAGRHAPVRSSGLQARRSRRSSSTRPRPSSTRSRRATSQKRRIRSSICSCRPRPTKWFTRVFDPKLAPALSAEWNESVFKKLGDMIPAFKAANKSGQTEVRVTFVCKEVPDGAGAQKAAFAAMTEPAVLYGEPRAARRVDRHHGGSFAVVASHLALVGKMTKAGGADPTPAPTAPRAPDTATTPSITTLATRGARHRPRPRRAARPSRLRGSRRSGMTSRAPSGSRPLAPISATLRPVQAPPPSPPLEKLRHFTLTSHQRPADEPWFGRAVDAWFAGGERELADWEQTSFSGDLAHGHADERGDRMIDHASFAPLQRPRRPSARRSPSIHLARCLRVALRDRRGPPRRRPRVARSGERRAALRAGEARYAWRRRGRPPPRLGVPARRSRRAARIHEPGTAGARGRRRGGDRRGYPTSFQPAPARAALGCPARRPPRAPRRGARLRPDVRARGRRARADLSRHRTRSRRPTRSARSCRRARRLEAGPEGRYFPVARGPALAPGPARGDPDPDGALERRRRSPDRAYAEGRRFVERLLGKLAHLPRRPLRGSPGARPLAERRRCASSRGRLPAERMVLAADVEASDRRLPPTDRRAHSRDAAVAGPSRVRHTRAPLIPSASRSARAGGRGEAAGAPRASAGDQPRGPLAPPPPRGTRGDAGARPRAPRPGATTSSAALRRAPDAEDPRRRSGRPPRHPPRGAVRVREHARSLIAKGWDEQRRGHGRRVPEARTCSPW